MRNTLITRPENLLDSFFSDPLLNNYSFGRNIDIYRNEQGYVVEVNIPGFTKNEISVHFENDVLNIEAKHEEKSEETGKKEFIYRSRVHNEYSRQIRFENVDSTKIDASYENGVLKVTLGDQAKEAVTAQRIEVK